MSQATNETMSIDSVNTMAAAPSGDISRAAQLMMIAVFTGAIFTGASLIFLIQPMVAKMALPLFGGSPAVWNTSMVFFQALLLAGYGYAHLTTRTLGVRRQSLVHLAVLLLPLLVLPLHLRVGSAQPDGVAPTLWLLLVLLATAGLPYVVVSTASPILQRWFSSVNHPNASDPYFLYAASNVGSLIALLAYPIVIEPNLTLSDQGRLWTGMYFVFVAFCAASTVILHRYPAIDIPRSNSTASNALPIAWRTRANWIFLAFVPSSLMVGVTGFLSTDVASAPFLWVLPLTVYLLTFILAFANRQVISVRVASLLLALATTACLVQGLRFPFLAVVAVIFIHLVLLFSAGMLAHLRLAQQRPSPTHLTEFYLLISIGGVLGGAFNALVAPLVFDSMLEYPIVIVLALLLRPGAHRNREGSRWPWLLDFLLPLGVLAAFVIAVSAMGASSVILLLAGAASLAFVKRPVRFAVMAGLVLAITSAGAYSALHAERTFFGVIKVAEESGNRHVLSHGTTVHGIQDLSSAQSRREPLSYYTRTGPIGQVFSAMQQRQSFQEVGVVGLGAGSLAAYGQPGQTFSFFEIDPSVVRIASNPQYFTYLTETSADIRMIVGDGRLRLEEESDGRYDLLVLDAFSSDSVPVHLLTVEAMKLYFQKVDPDGVVAIHISNRNLDLEPVVAAIANELGLAGLSERDASVPKFERDAGKTPSHWVVLARTEDAFGALNDDERWEQFDVVDGQKPWTDDFSNILETLRWFR